MSAQTVAVRSSKSPAPSPAKSRIIDAALKLFTERGVGGTSLQMIADEVGVTKAAVYHQYNTKAQIIRAVADAEMARLEAVLDAAEAQPAPEQVRDSVISGIIDLAIERRREVSTLLHDPLIGRIYARNKRLLKMQDRLSRLLTGADSSSGSDFATAMLTAAISGAVIHPLLFDRDDETLRTQLLHLTRRFLQLPD